MSKILQRGMRLWWSFLVCFLITSCGGGGGAGTVPAPPVTQEPEDERLLVSFSSSQEIVQFVRDGLADAGSGRVAEVALAADAAIPAAPAYSTSYRLESEVAESDLVQYNGELLLIAPSRSGGCCFIAVDAADEPMRSVIDGETVLFVTGTSLYFAPWSDLRSSIGPN